MQGVIQHVHGLIQHVVVSFNWNEGIATPTFKEFNDEIACKVLSKIAEINYL